jgi:hypothetical protein
MIIVAVLAVLVLVATTIWAAICFLQEGIVLDSVTRHSLRRLTAGPPFATL